MLSLEHLCHSAVALSVLLVHLDIQVYFVALLIRGCSTCPYKLQPTLSWLLFIRLLIKTIRVYLGQSLKPIYFLQPTILQLTIKSSILVNVIRSCLSAYIFKIVGGVLTFGLLAIALRRKFERKYTR